jgi:hypothetical protein
VELKSVHIRFFVRPNIDGMAAHLDEATGCEHRKDYRLRVSQNGNTTVLLNQKSERAMTLLHAGGRYAKTLPSSYEVFLNLFMDEFGFGAIKHDRENGSWLCIKAGNDLNEPSLRDRRRR